MSAYIEIVGAVARYGFELTDNDLREIGEFTRENIVRWLERGNCRFEVGVYGYEDFHAVCGDMDIPWNTLTGPAMSTPTTNFADVGIANGIKFHLVNLL